MVLVKKSRKAAFDPKIYEETGQFQIEIKGLAQPKSQEAARICREDLNEVIAAFVQDKIAIERGIFDEELVPEELTQVRMASLVRRSRRRRCVVQMVGNA
jgi:hypothetical protein